jgi:ADP-ribosylglycohydrolase
MNRDRIHGMFLGIAIGDALGMCVETFSAEKISEVYGRVTDYHKPDGHKWFNGEESGTCTDDCQLTIAVAKGMIENPLDMDAQAKYHVEALKETTKGWGNSTRNAVRRVANGIHWSKSFEPPTDKGRGVGGGNGVPMKIAPLGAYIWKNRDNEIEIKKIVEFISTLSQMTHGTSISASAALVQAFAIFRCLSSENNVLDKAKFSKTCLMASEIGKQTFSESINDDLTLRLSDLYKKFIWKTYDDDENEIDPFKTEEIIAEFGGGSCYCYNSIPFTHAFFLKNPNSIESLYDCISAGGDADSNGSMLGGMLGALNGTSIFPDHLIKGLKNSELIYDLSEEFCDFLGI